MYPNSSSTWLSRPYQNWWLNGLSLWSHHLSAPTRVLLLSQAVIWSFRIWQIVQKAASILGLCLELLQYFFAERIEYGSLQSFLSYSRHGTLTWHIIQLYALLCTTKKDFSVTHVACCVYPMNALEAFDLSVAWPACCTCFCFEKSQQAPEGLWI